MIRCQACNHPFLVLGRDQQQETFAFQGSTDTTKKSGSTPITAPEPTNGVAVTDDATTVTQQLVEVDATAGTTPSYVQELYRRFQERVAAEAREGEGGHEPDGPGRESSGATNAAGGGEGASVGSAGGTSRAFVDSVVGQLTVSCSATVRPRFC